MYCWRRFMVIAAFLGCVINKSRAVEPDMDGECGRWAEEGLCMKHVDYMHQVCQTSCAEAEKREIADAKQLHSIRSFFHLQAEDIHGEMIDFAQFKNQVTMVVNVASTCQYTDPHYKQLMELWSNLKNTGRFNILAFPCDQFGGHEPHPNEDILEFVQRYGVDFQMMSKIDVNGLNTHLVYKYLKHEAGPSNIRWNFSTYFIIGPNGHIQSYSEMQPIEFQNMIISMLGRDEL